MRLVRAVVAGTIPGIFTIAVACGDVPAAEPRATSGDDRIEPSWSETLTITVGPEGADVIGSTGTAVQAAVDLVSRLGGGTVAVMPGTFRLRNSIFLGSRVRLRGSGPDTVFIKEPSVSSKLAADSDWYDQEITLREPEGFKVGDGVCLRAGSARFAIKRTLVARDGARFKLDRPLRDNVWISDKADGARAATLFPIISGENISDAVIENLALDGNKAANDNLDGNYAGCIWLQDCNRITIRGVEARHFNGDGISWQVCHDVRVEDCHSHGHSGLGLHPGSGSQRSVIRNCRLEGNDIGLFFCWGVRFGTAEKNFIRGNRVGISIGHRDTDNLVSGNEIRDSREAGILFRKEKDAAAAGHRNRIEGNTLINNAGEGGAAVDVAASVREVVIANNVIRDTRANGRREPIRVAPEAAGVTVRDNTIEGFSAGARAAEPAGSGPVRK